MSLLSTSLAYKCRAYKPGLLAFVDCAPSRMITTIACRKRVKVSRMCRMVSNSTSSRIQVACGIRLPQVQSNKAERIIQVPQVGGLHHRYQRLAAEAVCIVTSVGLGRLVGFSAIAIAFHFLNSRTNSNQHPRKNS